MLHQRSSAFIMPNAWDGASAVLLKQAGFEALGSTSLAIAFALGRQDTVNPSLIDGSRGRCLSAGLPRRMTVPNSDIPLNEIVTCSTVHMTCSSRNSIPAWREFSGVLRAHRIREKKVMTGPIVATITFLAGSPAVSSPESSLLSLHSP